VLSRWLGGFQPRWTGLDFENFILMHVMGANIADQLDSMIAGGLLLGLVLRVM